MRTFSQRYTGVWDQALADVRALQLPTVLPALAGQWWSQYVASAHERTGLDDPDTLRPIELIWSYWHEEGKLTESMRQVCLRFANEAQWLPARSGLSRFDVSPLHNVSELLWGLIQDLDISRPEQRALEYMKQYGLRPTATRTVKQPVDTRSRFLQGFHTVLNTAVRFYRQLDDRFVQEDPRPLLNSLKQLHLIEAEGAHNQYSVLTVQVRVEMLVIQRILALDEFRQFLGGRLMVPYPEPWMDRVDSMRQIMQWGDTSITEFNNLATTGEWILLTVRHGPFDPRATNSEPARDWAIALRNEIMQYILSYQAVTGVDLTVDPLSGQAVDGTPPSVYLSARELHTRRRVAV